MGKPAGLTAWYVNERDAEFKACDNAGMTAKQLAERFNLTPRSVTRWRRRLGISHTPPPVAHPESDKERARQLLDQGCSFAEAGRTVGVYGTTIRNWFPDRPAWTNRQSIEHAVLVRTFKDVA